jgi:hypothetical protein
MNDDDDEEKEKKKEEEEDMYYCGLYGRIQIKRDAAYYYCSNIIFHFSYIIRYSNRRIINNMILLSNDFNHARKRY